MTWQGSPAPRDAPGGVHHGYVASVELSTIPPPADVASGTELFLESITAYLPSSLTSASKRRRKSGTCETYIQDATARPGRNGRGLAQAAALWLHHTVVGPRPERTPAPGRTCLVMEVVDADPIMAEVGGALPERR